MPIKPGYSRKTINANTKMEISHGRTPQQAYAIAMRSARKSAKRVGKKIQPARRKRKG